MSFILCLFGVCRVFCVYSARAVYSAWMELMCQVWVACGTPLSGDGFVLQLFNMKQLSSSSFFLFLVLLFLLVLVLVSTLVLLFPPIVLILLLFLSSSSLLLSAELRGACACSVHHNRWIDCSTQIKMKSSDGYGSFILSHYLILSNPSTTTDG